MNIYILFLLIIELVLAILLIFEERKSAKLKLCGENCNSVLISEYNNFFGVKNTYLGALTFLLLIIFEVINLDKGFLFQSILLIISSSYALFLIYVQKYKLKEFCTLCLTLSGLTFLTTFLHFSLR